MTLCEKMFMLLDEKGKKAVDLCNELNIKTGTMSNWKARNTDPPIKYLATICKFLEVSIYEFLEVEEISSTHQLTQNETELLKAFSVLSEREQIKWISRLEDAAEKFQQSNGNTDVIQEQMSSVSKIS